MGRRLELQQLILIVPTSIVILDLRQSSDNKSSTTKRDRVIRTKQRPG